MPLILGANSVSGYTVKNSLRFNSSSSDYLNRTPASAVSRQICTYSAWIKLSEIATERALISASSDANNYNAITIGRDSGVLRYYEVVSASTLADVKTSQLFRDTSAWYHIVVAIDSTQATSSNRIKIYVNGSQVTSFLLNTVFAQNTNTSFGSNCLHTIGKYADVNAGYFNGYHSEVYFINGQQLTPSSFGETDTDTGIWIPKAYTGTYGTNGFYLKFANSSSLGTDSSGNGNNFTVNNLTSVDQSTDTPTNNFCTMNSNDNYYASATFTEGNLQVQTNSGNRVSTLATFGVSKGKWYWECKIGTMVTASFLFGIDNFGATSTTTSFTGNRLYSWAYESRQLLTNNGSSTTWGSTYTTGDIIGCALDLDNNKLYFSKNGTWQQSGDPSAGTNGVSITAPSSTTSGFYFPAFSDNDYPSAYVTGQWNFGSPFYSANSYSDGAGYGNFSYSVPSGYYALCTKNLANFG